MTVDKADGRTDDQLNIQPNTQASRPVHGLVVAAGVGSRFGGQCPKQYTQVAGKTILGHTLSQLARSHQLNHLYLVVAKDDDLAPQVVQRLVEDVSFGLAVTLVEGGQERWQSVHQGVIAIADAAADADDLVLIHDAARPCVSVDDICQVVAVAHQQDHGAILANPVADTLKKVDDHGQIQHTIERQGLWQAQTPQVFRLKGLLQMLSHVANAEKQNADTSSFHITDEASGFEQLGLPIQLVEGRRSNIKLTYPSDLPMIEALLSMTKSDMG